MSIFKSITVRHGLAWLAAIILLFAPFSNATDIEDPAQVEHLTAKVAQTGSVSVSGSAIDWVDFNITIPQDTDSQNAADSLAKVKDEFGNALWAYEAKNPPNIVSYSGESTVDVFSRKTTQLPASYSVPEDVKRYMLPTASMQSTNQRIVALAQKIIEGKNTDFEKISALAMYVHDTVNYTGSLGTSAKDALWVLDNKIGTCDEYSTLFIALARSLGYPARYVSGYAYGDNGWIAHAWAEVYLGKWVPVDATWLEVGWLDATHITFYTSDDNKVENTANAYGVGTKKITWISGDTEVTTQTADLREKIENYSLSQTAPRLEPGEKTIVVLSIIPQEYAIASATLVPCKSDTPIVSIENKDQEAVLLPGKKKIIWWTVAAQSNLPENMRYTCPLVLNSKLLGEKQINIVVDTGGQEKDYAELAAEPKSVSIAPGESETIFVSAKRTGSNGGQYKIGIVSGAHYEDKAITSDSASGAFPILPDNIGKNYAVAFSSTGQVAGVEYEVRQSEGTRISNVSSPAFARVGSQVNISVAVKSPDAAEKSMRLVLKAGGNETVQNFVLKTSANLVFEYNPESAGEKTLRFTLSGGSGGAPSEVIEKIRAYDVPEIRATLSQNSGKNLALVNLEALRDEAENVSVMFLGVEKAVGAVSGTKSVQFDITAYGKSEAIIVFYDAAGGAHRETAYLDVKKEGLMHRIIRVLLSYLGKEG